MFTGIVTDIGEITAIKPGGQADDRRFVIRTRRNAVQQICGKVRDKARVEHKELERPAVEVEAEQEELLPDAPGKKAASL